MMNKLTKYQHLYNDAISEYDKFQHYINLHHVVVKRQTAITLKNLGKYAPKLTTEQQKIDFVTRLGKNLYQERQRK